MVLYTENPEDFTKTISTNEWIPSSFRIQNKHTKPCCLSLHWGWSICKKILVYNVSKTKYLRLNLIKGVRNLDIKNCMTLMKRTEDTNKWKDIMCS